MRIKIIVTFPEASAAHAQQVATGEGSNMSVALTRAFKEVLNRQGIKGKRLTTFRISGCKIENGIETSTED